MRTWTGRVLLIGGFMILSTACATSQEWAEWQQHSSHFASGDHLTFSFRNVEGRAPRVRRSDLERARAEQWWGKAITVSPDQIFQN